MNKEKNNTEKLVDVVIGNEYKKLVTIGLEMMVNFALPETFIDKVTNLFLILSISENVANNANFNSNDYKSKMFEVALSKIEDIFIQEDVRDAFDKEKIIFLLDRVNALMVIN